MNSKKLAATAIVAILIAVAVVLLPLFRQMRLVLSDSTDGRVFASYPVEEGDRFSITFIHSVNNTPLTDTYEVRGGEIYVVETLYYGFGAGVQTELREGETLSYTEDGAMVISGIDLLRTGMIYVVGKISDHVLEIGGEDISLRDLCGRGADVKFTIEHSLF